jgi:glucose-6-phosphate isomerase
MKISTENPSTTFINGQLFGSQVVHTVKKLIGLNYPVAKGTEGGLFFGLTHLYPGKVGDEYFMAKGHFHAIENRAQYYWGIEGEGILLLMDKERETKAEHMFPGSLHYIPKTTAHPVVNTGNPISRFGTCWPSDAGYNYDAITREGFSKRVKQINNKPTLI